MPGRIEAERTEAEAEPAERTEAEAEPAGRIEAEAERTEAELAEVFVVD